MTECDTCDQQASADAPLPCVTARGDGYVLQEPPRDCPHHGLHAEYVAAWEAAQETGGPAVFEWHEAETGGRRLEPPGGSDHGPLIGSETRQALCLEVSELLAEQYAYRAGVDTEHTPADVALRLTEIYAQLRALREA